LSTGFTAGAARNEVSDWKPMHFWFEWEEFATLNPFLTVIMSLPSGLTYDGSIRSKVEAKVSDCGKKLIVKSMWPSLLCDPVIMKEGFRSFPIDKQSLHAMVHAACLALAKQRKAMGFDRGQSPYSTTVVELPEEVESNFPEPVPIQDKDGAAVLVILLRLRRGSMEAPGHALVVRMVNGFNRIKKQEAKTPKKKAQSPKKQARYETTVAYPYNKVMDDDSEDDSTISA
jgi:hypothetical protein